jgi:hypothetical protein
LADTPPGRLAFRLPGPRWLRTTPAGVPVFDSHGRLELDPAHRPPPARSLHYRLVVRDAYLLTGRQPPVEVDGRWEMTLRDEGHLPPSAYLATRGNDVDPELLELARLTALPLRALQRWTPERREHELARVRAEHAAIQRAQRAAFLARLADLHSTARLARDAAAAGDVGARARWQSSRRAYQALALLSIGGSRSILCSDPARQ